MSFKLYSLTLTFVDAVCEESGRDLVVTEETIGSTFSQVVQSSGSGLSCNAEHLLHF